MNFLAKRLLGRMGPAGRLADLAVVGSAAMKLAQRAGLISDETAQRFGAAESSAGTSLSVGEMFLLAMALWRLARQFRAKKDTMIIEIVD